MVFNHDLRAGLTAGLTAACLASLAGCSFFHHHFASRHHAADETSVASAAAPESATPASAAADESATDAAVSQPDASSAAASASAAPAGVASDAINPSAPKRYTVKRGDTLWAIASMFLRDPWLWPEVWYVNPQVQNPHLIYPGDVLALAYGKNGLVQVRLEQAGAARLDPRLRSTPLESAIPTIPYSVVASFLSRPSLASNEEVSHAPHVLAFRDEHQTGGAGNEIYVRNLDAQAGARFAVVHIAEKLRDPDDGRTLGYEGIYTATAVVERAGNPAKAVLFESARETLRGDCLFPDRAGNPLNFMPRAPGLHVRGRIIAVVDDVHSIGQYAIVAINRGKRHGIEAGTVLAVDEKGDVVNDRGSAAYGGDRETPFQPHIRLPDERAGTILIFKSYDRMSYALVVGASSPMQVEDVVRNP